VEEPTRWYLIDELSRARGNHLAKRDYDQKQRVLGHFAGVLAGFRFLGAITQEEENAWNRKMLGALGYDLSDPPAPGTSQFMYLGDPAQRPEPHEPARQPRSLLRTIGGPGRTIDFHGGTLHIVGVDLYDTAVEIRWRLEPDIDIWQAFPQDAADLEVDLADVTDQWAVDELRRNATNAMRRLLSLSDLSDDAGTTYAAGGFGCRSKSGLGVRAWSEGHHAFRPTPPTSAHKLKWTWLNTTIAIPLP
jgi:hypothetical protein